MKATKRISAIFLALVLALSLLPVSVFAAGSDYSTRLLVDKVADDKVDVKWMVQTSNGAVMKTVSSIIFKYDNTKYDMLTNDGTVITTKTMSNNLFDHYMNSDGDQIVTTINSPLVWNNSGIYTEAKGTNTFVLINLASGSNTKTKEYTTETALAVIHLKLKSGAVDDGLPGGSIALADTTEAKNCAQSGIVIFIGTGEEKFIYGRTDGSADTLPTAPVVAPGTGVTFAQTPASVGTAPAAKTDLKYNGTEQKLVTAGTATNGTMQYSLDNNTWSTAVPEGKNAGDYTVYYKVKGDSGYSDSTVANVSVTIGQKSIADPTVTIDSIPNQTYTGKAIEPPLVVKDGTTVLEKGTDYTVSYPYNNTNAGLASLQVNGKGNYTGTKGQDFNIDRADQVLTVPGSANVAFNKTLDLNSICSSNAHGATLTFAKVTTSSLPIGTTFNESTGIVTAGNNTGSFIVTVNSAAVTNYKAALPKQITVYVVATPAASVTAAPTAKTGLTYNGNDQALVSDGTANGGTMQYSLDGTNWTDTVPKGKNAGDYTVYYKVEGDSDHTDYTPTSNTVSVSIAQKEVTVAPGTYKVSKEYNGTTAAGTGRGALSVTGIVDSGARVKATPVAYTDANVGGQSTMNVTINLDGTGNGNYKIKDGATTISVPCEITAKDVKLTGGINATDRSYVKDNKTVALTKDTLAFDGLVSGETLDVNIPATGTISDAKVGTYNVTYSGVTLKDGTTGKASNYKLVSPLPTVTVNITQAAAPAAPTGLNGVKGNALSTVTLPDGWTWMDGSTVMNTVGSPTFKANYTDAAGNYASATNVDVTVNVKNKTDVSGKISFNGGTLVYTGAGQKYETASISGITAGTGVTWTYAYTAVTGTLDGGLPKTVGTYTAMVTYEDSLNYGTKSVTLTITQATPTGAPVYTAITAEGKTLADAALGIGTIKPTAGALEWVDDAGNVLPGDTEVKANTNYKWRFTPTDTANYKPLTGSIQLWHKSTGGRYYYSSSNSSGTATITAVLTAKDAKSATDYTSGIYGLTFRSTADFSGFKGVKVDGKTIGKDNYVAESNNGSIEVYLKAAYLKTLAVGRHTLTVMATGGNASIDFTIGGVNTAPKTFDAGIAVYVTMAVASVTGMAWMGKKRED